MDHRVCKHALFLNILQFSLFKSEIILYSCISIFNNIIFIKITIIIYYIFEYYICIWIEKSIQSKKINSDLYNNLL